MGLHFSIPDLREGRHGTSITGIPLIGLWPAVFRASATRRCWGTPWPHFPNLTLKSRRQTEMDAAIPRGLRARLGRPRPYDRLDNPQNNGIGSRMNNATCVPLWLRALPISPRWARFRRGQFHPLFQRSLRRCPTWGSTSRPWSASIRYTPQPVEEDGLIRMGGRANGRPRRFGGAGVFFAGLQGNGHVFRARPSGRSIWAPLAGIYRVSKVQNLLIGLEYEYHKSIFLFSRHTFASQSAREARQDATRWMVFLGNEWLFGNTGLLVQAGYYVSGQSYLVPFPLYNRLGLRYYLPPVGRPATQFFASIYLKSHIITAEYISIGIGARVQ
jgi:hypothetical protein